MEIPNRTCRYRYSRAKFCKILLGSYDMVKLALVF